MRTVLCALLLQEGYNVVGEMANGDDFIPTVKRLTPDIVCLDQVMPGVEGLQLLRQLQAENSDIAVVMMTASADPAIRQKAVASGVAGFLKKPFSQEQIIEELKLVDHARRLLRKVEVQPNPHYSGLRVVLADDSKTMRQLLKTILAGLGLDIVGEANDGKQALALTTQHQPDLVCLDVEMPNMGGIDALAKIRAKYPQIKIIMVTGQADRNTVRQAASLGASGYILKPYLPEQVETALRKTGLFQPKTKTV
jgi:two-component system chemotaxis response regulator CheY